MFKPVTREKWVAALRSGEYEQAQGRMWDGDRGYCCLGVACSLAIGMKELVPTDIRSTLGTTMFENVAGVDAPALYSSLSLSQEEACALAGLNDSGWFSFKEIATLIERRWYFQRNIDQDNQDNARAFLNSLGQSNAS